MPWRPVRGALVGSVRDSGSGAPIPGALLSLGDSSGLTDAQGRFALPGRVPGSYPLKWTLPPDYLAGPDWPDTVPVYAGKVQTIDLAAKRIAMLSGTVEITTDGKVLGPTGPVSATDASGRVFETMAAAGDFKLLLPPGLYVIRYTGAPTAALAAKLVASVEVGTEGKPVAVRLAAVEDTRHVRQTLFIEGEKPPTQTPVAP
jgi:hypothetical protein